MKMLIVVYNDAIDETVITAFKEAEVKGVYEVGGNAWGRK
jgi:hypothetical protein